MVVKPLTPPAVWIYEPMPPEGWVALHMLAPMPPSKRFNRFIKL